MQGTTGHPPGPTKNYNAVGQVINAAGKIPVGKSAEPLIMDLGGGNKGYFVGYLSKTLVQTAAGRGLTAFSNFMDGKVVADGVIYLGVEISCGLQ